jgi:nitroreductase
MTDITGVLHSRHSARIPFDPARPITPHDLEMILDAARWAPTPHNMQNFEIIAVDDPDVLEAVGEVSTTVSAEFLRENYAQVSSSEEELARRRVGIMGTGFPRAWLDPASWDLSSRDPEYTRKLRDSLLGCPMLLVVLYDAGRRAPASEGDALGLIGLGCVLENMWLGAEALGIGLQVLASLAGGDAEPTLAKLLSIPEHMRVAFGCRLGYPLVTHSAGLRVRRDVGAFTHRNAYGHTDLSDWSTTP